MAQSRPAQRRSRHVLVVDDLPFSQELARLVLEAAGHHVDLAENGAEAVERVRRQRYDLVLMDLEMPVMDGYAASAAIRHLPDIRRSVPVVALTAKAGPSEAERCRQAGMDGHISKPFAASSLVSDVDRWTKACAPARLDPGPVWDQTTYRDLAARLGPDRMRGTLHTFERQLVDTISAIRAAPGDRDLLERTAHGLASTAGMLGFADLCHVSRRVMVADTEAAWSSLARDLTRAVRRALVRLRRGGRQAAEADCLAGCA